ncbi:MAG: hypothetical protein IJ272_10840, partial [Clostridia bacterium]|nr:hypothetical protein [Clostridia bacterium]
FDKVTILGDRADIKVECNFGSIMLYVPRNWKVSSNVELVCAGIKERGEHMGDGPTLYVSGEANFAGVVIKYV